MAAKIKKGDRVFVRSGRDKGKRGEVIAVSPAEGRALVARLGDGPVELVFGVDVIGAEQGSVQRISGVVTNGMLSIERASLGLARARWELVHREAACSTVRRGWRRAPRRSLRLRKTASGPAQSLT